MCFELDKKMKMLICNSVSHKEISYKGSQLLTRLDVLPPLNGSFLTTLSFFQNYVREDIETPQNFFKKKDQVTLVNSTIALVKSKSGVCRIGIKNFQICYYKKINVCLNILLTIVVGGLNKRELLKKLLDLRYMFEICDIVLSGKS